MNEQSSVTSQLEARSIVANSVGSNELVLAIAKALDKAYEEGQQAVIDWNLLTQVLKKQ